MKSTSNLKKVSCDTCSFLKRHFYTIILTTLVLSLLFLGLSILLTISKTSSTQGYLPEISNSLSLHETAIKVQLPIIMYHALIEDPAKQNSYFISPSHFEEDLKYLNHHGYTAITMTELIDFVHSDGSLPEKPIILTFDDGYYNNYYYAYPLLKKYNQKAVISIIGNQTDLFSMLKEYNVYYSHVTWAQLNEMLLSGHIEVQNHTYDLHNINGTRKGCVELKNEHFEHYREMLIDDVGLLQEKIQLHTGFTPNTLTYPFGKWSEYSEKVIKDMGFKASLTCAERMNYVEKNPDCLYKLGRFLRPPNVSSEDFFERVLAD